VGFDPDPASACHDRDRLPDYHWRPPIKESKIDEYSGIFALNKRDSGLFWHDRETMDENKRGYFGMAGRERGSFRIVPVRKKPKYYQIHPVKNAHIF
jgi:hypothetical protein